MLHSLRRIFEILNVSFFSFSSFCNGYSSCRCLDLELKKFYKYIENYNTIDNIDKLVPQSSIDLPLETKVLSFSYHIKF